MLRSLLLTVFLTLLVSSSYSQLPPPCGSVGDDPPGCFMCSPVLIGSNAGATPGNTPGNFCGVIHNNVWISFLACSTSISFTVVPQNCQNGEGLQAVVTDINLNPVSNCCSPPPNMVSCNVTATGLTPGDIYYVMIDGSTGDVCDFILTATGGFCFGQPGVPDMITADPNISPLCPGTEVTYTVPTIANASFYEWTFPPNTSIVSGAGTNEVTVVYNGPTAGVVCVTGQNPCFTGPPGCTPVLVQNIPPTILPPEYHCTEEFPIRIGSRLFNNPGSHTVLFESAAGCDSMVTYNLIQYPRLLRILNETICQGDCFQVGSQYYCNEDEYHIVLPDADQNGCDSMVTLRLNVLTPVAEIANPGPLPCTSNPSLTLDGTASSSNATYLWTAQNGGNIVSGQGTPTVNVNRVGRYILSVTVNDGFGLTCTGFDTVDVIRQVIPLDTIQFALAPVDICKGAPSTFTIAPVNGATSYTWSATQGATIGGNGTSVTINWDTLTSGTVCVNALNACGQSPDTCLDVTIHDLPISNFSLPPLVCRDSIASISYTGNAPDTSLFTWNFNGGTPSTVTGPGPHEITWSNSGPRNITLRVEDEFCESETSTEMIQVENPLPLPNINCNSDQTEITFTWDPVPGATDYDIVLDGQSIGNQTDTFYYAGNLVPNQLVTISVSANGSAVCGPSISTQLCQAQNCPTVDLNIDPVADFCLESNPGAVQLNFTQTGGAGNGSVVWQGPGTSVNGMFDPNTASLGSNTVMLSITEGTCVFTEDIIINVYEAPTANFTADSIICLGEGAIINYTGNGSNNSTFNWNFDGGNIISGSNQGPIEVSWNTPGTHIIELDVTENNCPSGLNTRNVIVEDSLETPLVTCQPSTNGVTFSWPNVPGADNYQVNLIYGQAGTLNGNAYTINGLNPNDTITIEVIATGQNPCGPSATLATCIAEECPPISLDVDPINPICDNGNAQIVNLSAIVNGGSGTGTFTWTGPGVQPNGTFDPNAPSVNPPSANIRLVYEDGNCLYDTLETVSIIPQPSNSFTTDARICVRDTLNVEYTGSASTGATYMWDFGNGTAPNGTGIGNFGVVFPNAGSHQISLQVEENNCASEIDTLTVQVDPILSAPMITCTSNSNGVEFNWMAVNGADYYDVNVLTSHSGSMAGNSYTVNGLVPTEQVTIEVVANGQTLCGPSRDTLTCEAQDCPDDVNLIMSQIGDICLNANLPPVNLADSLQITGSLNNPNITWEGDLGSTYLTPGGLFYPYNAAFGANQVRVIVEENGCSFSQNMVINVYPLPLSGFQTPGPTCANNLAEINALYVSPNASYTWDFGNGTLVSGSGAGPLLVDYSGYEGVDTVSLTVEENGCSSDATEGFISIQNPLAPPNINCDASLNEITFSWDPVPGAGAYQIDIDYQPPGSTITGQSDFDITFSNLMQGDSVTITVTVIDTSGVCDPASATITCYALDCPPITVSIDEVRDTCMVAGTPFPIQLNAVIRNGTGSGTGTWMGNRVNSSGIFSPIQPGVYNVSYQYIEDGCPFNASRTITMYEIPSSMFTATQPICLDDFSTVNYTGTQMPGANYTWNFNGGTPANVMGPGPHQIQWPSSGAYTLTLSVEANGCVSTLSSNDVMVDEPLDVPVIDCNPTTNSIEFCWTPDPIASNYTVSVSGGFSGVRNGDCYTISNLPPDTEVIFTLTGVSGSACEDVIVMDTCSTLPCPNITLTPAQVEDICLSGSYPIIDLNDSLTINPAGNGMVVWSGNGVQADGSFDPETNGEGNYTVTATYIESGCQYTTNFNINVNDPPIADAGEDQILTCIDTIAELGDIVNTGNDPGVQFTWSGGVVNNNSAGQTTTIQAGIYTLLAVDPSTGCSTTDEVEITVNQDPPVLNISTSDVACAGETNGSISVESVSSGTPPYSFSLNGGSSTTDRDFNNLPAGDYELRVVDQNGCEDVVNTTISSPSPLTVSISLSATATPVPLGDSIQLRAVLNVGPNQIQSIVWEPGNLPVCDTPNIQNCLSFFTTPSGTTLYRVSVTDINGCIVTAELLVQVEKIRPVYIPSAFSPTDDDGINDLFLIYGGPQISKVKSFLIFDRWGNLIHEYYNFDPSDQRHGWDGTYKGKEMNSNVYVFFAEIEFLDGEVEIYKGDVTLK
ncbi:MAG: PKD domain-containing protein [Saprospiraceae bacterium]